MAIIKKSELVHMREPQLIEKLTELKKEMIKVNAQIAIGTIPENPGRIKEIKKTIARLNTLLKQLKEKAEKEKETKKKEKLEEKKIEKSKEIKKTKKEVAKKSKIKKAEKLSKKLKELKKKA